MPDQPAPNLEEARRVATPLTEDWFDAILESAEKWPDDGPHIQPKQFVRALVRQGRALLNEREAREEQLEAHHRWIAERPAAQGQTYVVCPACGATRKVANAALPATESAQGEQPTSEAGS